MTNQYAAYKVDGNVDPQYAWEQVVTDPASPFGPDRAWVPAVSADNFCITWDGFGQRWCQQDAEGDVAAGRSTRPVKAMSVVDANFNQAGWYFYGWV